MINPISSAQANSANQVSQPVARQPQPPAQAPPQDKVTLKSAGDADHDGDNK